MKKRATYRVALSFCEYVELETAILVSMNKERTWELDETILTVAGKNISVKDFIEYGFESDSIPRRQAELLPPFDKEILEPPALYAVPFKTKLEAMMKAGFGLFVQCEHPGEADKVVALAEATGRGKDIRVMKVGGDETFNVLNWLRDHKYGLPVLFKAIPSNDGYPSEWNRAAEEHLKHLCKLFELSGEEYSISTMILALDDKDLHRRLLQKALDKITNGAEEEFILVMLADYFTKQWAKMGSKTRESILSCLLGNEVFGQFCELDGVIKTLFCSTTTFEPKELRNGAILVLDITGDERMTLKREFASRILKTIVSMQLVEPDYSFSRIYPTEKTRPVIAVMGKDELDMNGFCCLYPRALKTGMIGHTDKDWSEWDAVQAIKGHEGMLSKLKNIFRKNRGTTPHELMNEWEFIAAYELTGGEVNANYSEKTRASIEMAKVGLASKSQRELERALFLDALHHVVKQNAPSLLES